MIKIIEKQGMNRENSTIIEAINNKSMAYIYLNGEKLLI